MAFEWKEMLSFQDSGYGNICLPSRPLNVCPAGLDDKCQAFQSYANFWILGNLSLAKKLHLI